MSIEKYNQTPALSSEIKNALGSTIARNASVEQIKKTIGIAVTKAFQDAGQLMNDKDSEYMASVLPGEILRQVPAIRIDEIQIAINRGMFGDFGEYFGLNTLTFITFLKKYMESKERAEAVQQYHQALQPAPTGPTEQEVQDGIKKAIVNAYNRFVEKGFYEDYGNFIYDKMDSLGLVALSSARKAQIFEQARQSIANRKSLENAQNLQEHQEFSKVLDLINNPDSVTGRSMIKTEAKKIALQVVFHDFLDIEADITELVNQTQEF